jgi:hypothetical protein
MDGVRDISLLPFQICSPPLPSLPYDRAWHQQAPVPYGFRQRAAQQEIEEGRGKEGGKWGTYFWLSVVPWPGQAPGPLAMTVSPSTPSGSKGCQCG